MHFSGKQLSKKIRWLKYSGPGAGRAGGKRVPAPEHGRGSTPGQGSCAAGRERTGRINKTNKIKNTGLHVVSSAGP